MPDDSFLACYFTSDFLAVSYQKKLIEQVIDARLSKKSLLTDSSFVKVYEDKRARVAATIYCSYATPEYGQGYRWDSFVYTIGGMDRI